MRAAGTATEERAASPIFEAAARAQPANDAWSPGAAAASRGPLAVDVGEVISKALRAAGLMK